MKKCQGTHKKEEKFFLLFEKRSYFSCLFISFLSEAFFY